MEEKGCVYFFKHIGLSPIKIGYSENISPLERFNQFKTYAPFGAELIGFIITCDSKKLETLLHKKYSNKRLKGEWFEISNIEIQNEIDFYSSIEDVKDKSDFQIAWAQKNEKTNILIKDSLNLIYTNSSENIIFLHKNNISIKDISKQLNVSVQYIYRILKKNNI